MGKIKNQLKQLAEQTQGEFFSSCKGIIKSYDKRTNKADISFFHPVNGSEVFLNRVSVVSGADGYIGLSPAPGQHCLLEFPNGQIFHPVVTKFLEPERTDHSYQLGNHKNQGAFLIPKYEPVPTVPPLIRTLFDESNENKDKYMYELYEDTIKEIKDFLDSIGNYSRMEQGMTNPYSQSTIKVGENGDINLFVDHNMGIRISPSKKQIEILTGTISIHSDELTIENKEWKIVSNVSIDGNLTVSGKIKSMEG